MKLIENKRFHKLKSNSINKKVHKINIEEIRINKDFLTIKPIVIDS